MRVERFGDMVRLIRTEKGLTLRSVCLQSGIDVGYLSRIERCSIQPPQKADVLTRLYDALELDTDDRRKFTEQSAIDNRTFPEWARKCEGFPVFIKTVGDKRLSEDKIRELTEYINKNY